MTKNPYFCFFEVIFLLCFCWNNSNFTATFYKSYYSLYYFLQEVLLIADLLHRVITFYFFLFGRSYRCLYGKLVLAILTIFIHFLLKFKVFLMVLSWLFRNRYCWELVSNFSNRSWKWLCFSVNRLFFVIFDYFFQNFLLFFWNFEWFSSNLHPFLSVLLSWSIASR